MPEKEKRPDKASSIIAVFDLYVKIFAKISKFSRGDLILYFSCRILNKSRTLCYNKKN